MGQSDSFFFDFCRIEKMKTKTKPVNKSKSGQLEQIPGVGGKIAQALRDIGIGRISDLKGRNPEKLYRKFCEYKTSPVDRCMLYVLRCAVYYASNAEHDPKLLKWWNWKDRR